MAFADKMLHPVRDGNTWQVKTAVWFERKNFDIEQFILLHKEKKHKNYISKLSKQGLTFCVTCLAAAIHFDLYTFNNSLLIS